MKYVVIKNKEVVNAIEWDGETDFTYPFEHDEIFRSDELQIGMKLIDGVWKYEDIEHISDVTE